MNKRKEEKETARARRRIKHKKGINKNEICMEISNVNDESTDARSEKSTSQQ